MDVKRAAQLSEEIVERIVIDLALERNRRIRDLGRDDFNSIRSSAEVLRRFEGDVSAVTGKVQQNLMEKIERGRADIQNTTFMHMGPHHDDIMLGYLGYVAHLVRPVTNKHTFNYATSGFTAVTNGYVLDLLQKLKVWIASDEFRNLMADGYFKPDFEIGRSRDVFQYLDGIAAHSRTMKDEGEARRLMRNLIFLY